MRQLLLLIVATTVSTAAPILADDAQDCFQGQDPEIRINGCSKIIERDAKDAIAYHHRAVAFGLKGDLDRAIADYTKAIEIAPNSATAYDNRGRAYASKGDYTSALADANKANELLARATAQPAVITPKTPKTATTTKTTTAAATKATTIPPKTKEIPNASKAGKEAPGSDWWSWLWVDSAGEASGKKAKP